MRPDLSCTGSIDPRDRVAAWEREEPAELRHSADEWDRLGYSEYATSLRRWADGDRTTNPATLRPWL